MSNYFEEWGDYFSENNEKHITSNKELKQLEERKLMEESDIQLTKELFEDEKITNKEIISINSNKINVLKAKHNNQKK